MGIMNWIVQKTMIGEAKKIAKWARKRYDEVKAVNSDLDEKGVHIRMFFNIDKFNNVKKEEYKQYTEACCQTIEGLCYIVAMDFGSLKGFMKFRLLQFTKYMDHYLYALGFKPQTKAQKENILKTLKIYSEDWEKWTR